MKPFLQDPFYTVIPSNTSAKCLAPRGRSARSTLVALTLALSLSVVGCSSKSSGSADGEGDGSISESDLDAQREGRFGSGSIPTAEGDGLFKDIHFDYDSSALDDAAQGDLSYNVGVLEQNSGLKVILEGHCDERGTVEYNMALGADRARSIKNALVSMGISSSRIETISYGEELPLDPGHSESAFAKNRRVHFSATSSTGSAAKAPTKGSQRSRGVVEY